MKTLIMLIKHSKHTKRMQVKLSDFSKDKFKIVLIAIAAAVGLCIIVLCFVFATQNTADPKHFVLNNRLDCTINYDRLIYNEPDNCDCIEIDMTFKNVTKPYDNSDSDMRTADQISPEEEDAMTDAEKEEINRNTILKRTSEMQTQFDISAVLLLQPKQNGAELIEPGADVRSDGKENNEDALSPRLAIGDTANVKLYFKLANQSDINIAYVYHGMTQKEDNTITEEFGDNQMIQEVTFARGGQTTPQMWAYLVSHSLNDDQNVNNVEWHDLKIPLRDGWYVDKQGNAALTLKNPNKDKAIIEFSYSSSQTAEQNAKETAAMSKSASEITTTTINGTMYYTYTNGNLIALYREGAETGTSIRIALTNISLDDAQPFL